jgi:hypothetical protein
MAGFITGSMDFVLLSRSFEKVVRFEVVVVVSMERSSIGFLRM